MKICAFGKPLFSIRFGTAAALICLPVGAALAQPMAVVTAQIEPEFTQRVTYADLDLATKDGKKLLFRRVRSAVNSVCSDMLGPSPIYYAEHSCRRATWWDTRPQMDRVLREARLDSGPRQAQSGVSAAVKVSARK